MNPYKVVQDFEKALSEYTGAPFVVTVESCSAALFLCCLYYKVNEVEIPKRTYPSVAWGIIHANGKVKFRDEDWQQRGYYYLGDTPIVDSAKYIARNMYENFYLKGKAVCLSFHARKALPIGRGGCVLTANNHLAEFIRIMRHDGRTAGVPLKDDNITMAGWNMLLEPEKAARGLMLMGNLEDENKLPYEEYPDIYETTFFKR